MAIQPFDVQYRHKKCRAWVVVGRLYDDGFLYLKDDPGVWIQSNPHIVSSVRSFELDLESYEGERIGDSIGELSQLTHLSIQVGCHLKCLPNTLSRLHHLHHLELDLWNYKGERIGDSIGELSQLTHLSINGGYLKCLPNTLSRLHNLHHLVLFNCNKLEELPANLGDLYNLTYLSLMPCHSLKLIESVAKLSNLTTLVMSRLKELPPNLGGLYNLKSLSLYYCENYVIESVAKLSNLTTLTICDYGKLEELPANLGDLKFLASLFLDCDRLRCLPWSITKLSNLRFLYLPREFRIETLPPHLNDSIIISVEYKHIRKTWKELKTQITEFPIITEELAAQKTSTPGYLRFKGDPTLWIRDYNNYGLLSSLRVLDLDLGNWICPGKIPDSIGELSQLTHLYISNGCLPHHLPPTFSRLTHLSLIRCIFECHTISHFDSLANLSTLTSLHLCPVYNKLLPEHMDLPISLTHLTLDFCYSSFPDRHIASMAMLSNLNTLTLSFCGDLESLPLHLNLTKLILRETTIKSLPIGLKHLEIIHRSQCEFKSCNQMQKCLENQLVNLETLSYKCQGIKSLSSVTSLHNLRELQLKDCFNLRELPPDLDKLVNLYTLDVSGTRIHSLPDSIINLHNLRHLILPKRFILKSLPDDFEKKVMISVDDTDESYYKYKGYHDRGYEIINDCDYMTSDSIKEINKKFLEKFKPDATVTVIEQASPHRPSNHQPDATRIIEGSLLNDSADPTCNNNHNGLLSSLTQEMEILPTRNEAGTKPDVVAELFSNNAPMDFEAFNTDISNFPYRNNIPAVIMDNLVGWKDVEADGNCGFRCVAEVFHGGQENWPIARRAILNELKAHPDVYQKIYPDDYDSALRRIDWNDGQCGEDHYMKIVDDLFPIANFYQCIVMCFFVTNDGLNPQLSATVLPWNVGAHSTRPAKEFTIAHLGTYKHYILLDLKDDFPVPPILHRWSEIRDKTVLDWVSQYEERGRRWDLLTNCSRDYSTHLDISDDECFLNSSANTRQDENARHGKVKNKTQKIEITRESIDKLLPQGMRLEDAATQLKVSRSTFKRALKNYGITWPSIKKRKHDSNKSAPHNTISSSGRNNSADRSTPTGHDHMVENSYGPNRCSLPHNLPSDPNAVTRTVEEPSSSTHCHTNGHQCVEEQSNGAKACELLNAVQPNEDCSTFVVKATYNNDTVRFNFSLSFGIEQLKEEVRKRLDLEVGKFKINYQDEDKEWMLMTCVSDLSLNIDDEVHIDGVWHNMEIKQKAETSG